MAGTRDGFWRWLRFTMAALEATRPGLARFDLQTIRDWVLRFNAKGPDGLVDSKGPESATEAE